MPDNKTKPTAVSVDTFLSSVSESRQSEAQALIEVMQQISNHPPVMWGPSIIGFGSQHYKYDTGREGDTPRIGFSPRKTAITVYFTGGFDSYSDQLAKLGKYKTSVSCLYINKLRDIDMDVLRQILRMSYENQESSMDQPSTVDEYVDKVPASARSQFDKLREIVKGEIPQANEVISYGIIGYKTDDKRARVYVSGWKDHVAMYPVPKNEILQDALAPYIKGKGTLWFPLDQPLPTELIKKTVQALL